MRVTAIKTRGDWSGPAADRIALNYDDRHRRRIVLTGENGLNILLDLPQAYHLRGGDGLELDDGRIVEILAEPEALLEVRGRNRHHLLRIAWHLGNRHLPAQIESDRILIRRDHVIAQMLEQQGASLREIVEPFDPETGAYGHSHDL
jgi:urease accessory protein